MGFRQPVEVSQTVRRWLAGAPRALRGAGGAHRSSPSSCRSSSTTSRAPRIPTPRSSTFDRFLGNLHGGARLFSLLRQNPDLVALVARVLGTAPRLADTLARIPR